MTTTKLLDKKYSKIYVLDTNIILNESSNIELLSQDGNNLIVIPETVLDEIDAKKSGHDEINFQARQFQRQLQDTVILDNVKVDALSFINISLGDDSLIDIHIISKDKYNVDGQSVDRKIINDRKIIEVAQDVKRIYNTDNVIFLSLDLMARTRAISLGVNAETLKIDKDLDNHTIDFACDFEVMDFGGDISLIPEVNEFTSNVGVTDPKTGKQWFYFKTGCSWELIDEKNSKRVPSVPRNRGQKVMSELILDDANDIIVISGPAGCVMPGTNITIDTDENYISKREFQSITGLSDTELQKIRKMKLIPYNKITNNIIEYDIGSYDSYVEKIVKLKKNNISKLLKEGCYESKYLKLSYWLRFLDENEAAEKVLFCRKYSHYFDIDFHNKRFDDFKNIEAVYIIKFKLLSFKYTSIFDINNFANKRWSKDYWIMRGWSEEESIDKVFEIQQNNYIKKSKKYTNEEMRKFSPRCIEYFLEKGLTSEEAQKELTKNQTTFSLKICIEKYGEEGQRVYNKRQQKWKDSMDYTSFKTNRTGKYNETFFKKYPDKANETGYLYYFSFIFEENTYYKIGITKDINRRMRYFSYLNPEIISIKENTLQEVYREEAIILKENKEIRVTLKGISSELFTKDIYND